MTKRRSQLRLRTAILTATLLVLTACSGGDTTDTTVAGPADDTATTVVEETTPTAEETTTTAVAEPASLVLYSGRNENFVQPVIDAFVAATGIEVDVRYGGTGDLATTIVTEGANSPADVFWAQDPAFIGGLAKLGLLTVLPEDILALVEDRYVDDTGHWVGITGRSRVLIYNTDLVASSELPADVWELTEPQWSGRVGVAPTNGSFVAFVSGMVLAEGEDATRSWLEGIAANNPVILDGNGPIVDAVVAGDLEVGLTNHYYLLQRISEFGDMPARNHFFGDDDPGGMVMATGAGILASSGQSEAAAELIRFLLTEESQAHFLTLHEYPLLDGVGTPEAQLSLVDLPTLDISLTGTADTLDTALTLIAESGLS